MEANHADGWAVASGLLKPVPIKRGQFMTGRYSLNKGCYPKQRKSDPSPSTTWRWLECLQNMQNLRIETNSRFSIVTITHFTDYNDRKDENEQVNEQPVNSRRTAGEQPVNTNKNDKNEEEERGPRKLPPEFDTPEVHRALADWLSHLDLHRKPLLDPDHQLYVACSYFPTPDDLVQSIQIAITNGYVKLINYAGQDGRRTAAQKNPSRLEDPCPERRIGD